jgi:hypothetical protein
MKGFVEILTTIVVAMLLSCAVNSLAAELGLVPKVAPSPMGTNIKNPGSPQGMTNPNRRDFMYGDFNIVDRQPRPYTGYAVKVVDDNSENQVEFPSSW